jgi:hypothetical protein
VYRHFFLWALLAFAAISAQAAPAIDITGQYRATGTGMVVAFGTCASGRMCGRIIALGNLPSHDTHNPAPALRSRPLCGLAVLGSLDWQDGAWRGTLYEPRNGTDYAVSIAPAENGAVRVTGYSGRPVLSRVMTRPFEFWERVAAPADRCSGTPVTS